MPVRSTSYAVEGGLDLVTPALKVSPGRALVAKNYEMDVYGGMSRILGFERFDGQQKPSTATYWEIEFDAGDGAAPAVDDVVTGTTSSATGVVLQTATLTSGAWGVDAAGTLVLGRVQGVFVNNDELQISATRVCDATGGTTKGAASTDALHATYLALAIAEARTQIAKVPGSGKILGVHTMNDGKLLAFRNNAGGTAVDMYVATAAGWVLQDLGATITFDTGAVAAPAVGDTITGGTSGASATITFIHELDSGTYAGGNATGTYSINGVTSGPFQAEALTFSGTTTANALAAETDVTLAIDGRYEIINYNFGGFADTINAYGVDGKNKGFMWDGVAFVQITTGMTTDTPKHLAAHQQHLFYSFDGSLQNSAITDPHSWSVLLGASEIGTGDVITALQVEKQYLIVLNRDRTYILTGTSNSDWALRDHAQHSGAVEYTAQNIGHLRYLDDRGLTELYAVQAFGDFHANTFAHDIQPYIKTRIKKAVSSVIIKEKNQYRLFFNDNEGVIATFDKGQLSGITTVNFGMPVRVTSNGEESNWLIPFDAGTIAIKAGSTITGGTSGATCTVVSSVTLDSGDWDGTGVGSVEVMRLSGDFVNNDTLLVNGVTTATATAAQKQLATGVEVAYFGSDDGYIYQMESGNTFDGTAIDSSLRLVFNNVGSPEWRKRFRKAAIEISASPTATIVVLPEFDYGDPDIDSPVDESATIEGGGAFWDEANWNEFNWGSKTVGKLTVPIDGSGENLSLLFTHDTATDAPFTIQGVVLHYSYRSRIR
jgi:hypothetical protein